MLSNAPSDVTITSHQLFAFSMCALKLAQLASEQAIEDFNLLALSELCNVVSFDKAWWGRAIMSNGMPNEGSYHLFNLPRSYLDDWHSIREEDISIAMVNAAPDTAIAIDTEKATEGLKWLGRQHNFREYLCVIHRDRRTQIFDHLTLYRAPASKPFTPIDKFLVENLMKHLISSVTSNEIRTLVAKRSTIDNSRNLALGVSDVYGNLRSSEHGFTDLLLTEWPTWKGPKLPSAIIGQSYRGERIFVEASPIGDRFLLSAKSIPSFPQLSLRQNEVAVRFGEGMSYKEIARELGLAPHTVRHHIKNIYSKLGIRDKASIAQLQNYSV
ncbi:helix-turn-helix transcriptional regulator [Pseudomonas sp. S32]|uniref:helix-turn-helix transcriptional regulator n=1 Tax=Pseudomonas sp. S32 TaxID=2767448 RepID=UPI00191180A6|nr:helix-turn-helix transcriptional regulator [Pseudomonas sp. S32]MBK5006927.1 helix-turn-helix transcriptional regulator [Pseudomonas sp. S32]